MKVSDLIAERKTMDQNAEVLGCCEDAGDGSPGSSCDFFLVESVDAARAVLGRDENRDPTVTIDSGPGSRSIVMLELVSRY